MSETLKKFSQLVRDARQSKGVSLRAAASELDIAASYLSDIENDRRIPAEEVTRKISEYFNIDLEELTQSTGKFRQEIEQVLKDQPMPQYTYQLFRTIKESSTKIDKEIVEKFQALLEEKKLKQDGADR